MNKLSIRPRNLDAYKFIPIYKCEEIPDLNDYASINRSMPQLPTGMEKEEESEHHLQRAISAQQSTLLKGTTGELVIPTPEVYDAPESFYNNLYKQNFKLPRQLIHVQPFAFEHDIPDYDHDSEDEVWLENQIKDIPNLTSIKFEELIDCFDKSSSQHVISLNEAKTLIKEDEDLIIAVYDYWLNKRLRLTTPLIPVVKTERRDQSTNNSNSNNPYIAFRRRTEKMQTRKNRKNDEISYEKMIKLKRDLSRSLNLLQLVRRREETKKELVKLTVDIFEKRYLLGDYNGNIINEISAQRQIRQQANYLPINNMKANENKPPRNKDDQQPRKKREYRKRHRPEIVQQRTEQELNEFAFTSDDEDLNDNLSHSISDQDEDDSDGPYAFKRKKGCQYYAPISDPFGSWPYYQSAEERAANNNLFNKYCLTEIKNDNRKQYTRRRFGRGGRIMLDRGQFNPIYKNMEVEEEGDNSFDDFFRPKSPFKATFQDSFDEDSNNDSDLIYFENGNTSSINLNHYIHDQTDLYTEFRSKSDADLTKFKNHQKELIERLNQQREKQSESRQNDDVEMMDSEQLSKEGEQCMNSLNTCNNEINNRNQSSIIANHNSSICNSVIPNLTNKSTINNSNSFVNNTTSLPQSKSSLSTLDSKSINFAVSAVLSTVNNNSSTSINSSSTYSSSLTPNTPSAPVYNNNNNNSTNGPAQINSSLNNNLSDYDKLFPSTASNSDHQRSSPSQTNSSANTSSISNSHLNSSLMNNLQKSQQQSPQLASQTIQQQWSNQQQSQANELTITNSSNMLKLKYQNNSNNLNSEPKLTPTDVT